MGTMILAAGTTTKSGNPAFTFIILAVLVGLFYVLIMRPQRNRQRKAVQTQSQVMPGQRVRTTAGMYGTVVSGDDRDVVIEIAPGVEVTMLRRAIMEVSPTMRGRRMRTSTPMRRRTTTQEPEAEAEDPRRRRAEDDWDIKNRNI